MTLTEVAEVLRDSPKKVQLIYAFNGTGKTRLSREFKSLVDSRIEDEEDEEREEEKIKVIYYNAYTEDLFYWDNDLDADTHRKLIIRPNNFTNFAMKFLRDEGQDRSIVSNFQYYTNNSITPLIDNDFTEVSFTLASGGYNIVNNIKISKGEESTFIWCVFYSLLQQVIEIRNIVDEEERSTQVFNKLEYVFIDDPVSSLDENHLIELAVNIAELIKSSQSKVKFIITTHNPLFYNVLHNEFNNASLSYGYRVKHSVKRRLEKLTDGTFLLSIQNDDSPFSYHLFLLTELNNVLETGQIKKYHFNFLRNILEKTSTFLGYRKWKDLLPGDTEEARELYYYRIINLSSHSNHHGHEAAEITQNQKNVLRFLVNEIKSKYHFYQNINLNDEAV